MAKQKVLLFEMPFSVDDPLLVKPSIGIERVRLQGRRHSFSMDITLLDTPDHRLLRAGVVLAHRVVDGLGQWYLDAPTWTPWLPANATHDMGAAGDLPQKYASLVRPFRRRASLGPVAAVTCLRRQWQLLDADAEVLATLRDDQLTIQRGGLIMARYRELTLTAHEGRTSREQRNHLTETLLALGATRVDQFPTLTERIGAPATGLTDFRGPVELSPDADFEHFVSWLFARRLDRIMRADLALRSGQDDDLDHLREELVSLHRELRSLSFALEPVWRAEVEKHIEVVLTSLPGRTVHQLGDEYFGVIDALVLGVRAPKIGDLSGHRASDVLSQQAVAAATILFDRALSLTLSAGGDRWAATLASAQQLHSMAATDRAVFGKAAKRTEKALDECLELLRRCQLPPESAQPAIDMTWDAATAFQEGRHYERRRQECMANRRVFVDAWPGLEERMRSNRKMS